jgi:hypothetical protein
VCADLREVEEEVALLHQFFPNVDGTFGWELWDSDGGYGYEFW